MYNQIILTQHCFVHVAVMFKEKVCDAQAVHTANLCAHHTHTKLHPQACVCVCVCVCVRVCSCVWVYV